MAEFQEVMRQWRRMCQYMDKEHGNSSCDNCPLGGCSAVYEMCGKENFANMERDISAWAAEHPVVYPTWVEWLVDSGVFPQKMSTIPSVAFNTIRDSLSVEIPADIAQKLGIEPKEG